MDDHTHRLKTNDSFNQNSSYYDSYPNPYYENHDYYPNSGFNYGNYNSYASRDNMYENYASEYYDQTPAYGYSPLPHHPHFHDNYHGYESVPNLHSYDFSREPDRQQFHHYPPMMSSPQYHRHDAHGGTYYEETSYPNFNPSIQYSQTSFQLPIEHPVFRPRHVNNTLQNARHTNQRFPSRAERTFVETNRPANSHKKLRLPPPTVTTTPSYTSNPSTVNTTPRFEHSASESLISSPHIRNTFSTPSSNVRVANRNFADEINITKSEFPDLCDSLRDSGSSNARPSALKINEDIPTKKNISNITNQVKDRVRVETPEKTVELSEFFNTVPLVDTNYSTSKFTICGLSKAIGVKSNDCLNQEMFINMSSKPFSNATNPSETDYPVPTEYLIYPYIKDSDFTISCKHFHDDLLLYLYYLEDASDLKRGVIANLYSKNWRYNIKTKKWIKLTNLYKIGDTYTSFDPVLWEYYQTEDKLNQDDFEKETYAEFIECSVCVATSHSIANKSRPLTEISPKNETDAGT